jgi:hypothetical protein
LSNVLNPALQQAARWRELRYRRRRRATGLEKILWWQRHTAAQVAFRRDIRAARRQAWRNFCTSLEQDFTKAACKVKFLCRKRQQNHTFSHPDGPVVAAEAMRTHLATVYDDELLVDTTPDQPECSTLPISLQDCPFDSSSNIDVSILELPNRKAPGSDHIKAEMLKPIASLLSEVISLLLQICWQWQWVSKL